MLGFVLKFCGPLEWEKTFKELSIFVLFISFSNVFGVWHWNLGLGVGGFVDRFFSISKFLCLTNMDNMSFELCL